MKNESIKNQNNIKDNNIITQEEQILYLLHKKLEGKNIKIPNDQSIKILLQNENLKNLISFTLNKHSEIEQQLKIKKKVSFYFVNNQKIDEYIKLKSINIEKKQKLLELQSKLNKIKEQRKLLSQKNEEILEEINEQEKNDKLARIKLKILNNSNSSLILELKNDYKKFSYINGYKYSHLYPHKNIGAIIENENEEDNNDKKENFEIKNENKAEENIKNDDKKEKNEEQISFISLNDISSLNESKINQIVNLPKLSQEDLMKYIKYSQKLFFDKTIKELQKIKNEISSSSDEFNKNAKKSDEKSALSIISQSSRSKDNKLQKTKEITIFII